MAAPFEFDRRWHFDVPRPVLWEAVSATDRFEQWWPWLDGRQLGPLAPGTTAQVVIRPPLPYRLHLTIDVVQVEPGSSVEARVGGDVEGPAVLEVEDDGVGSTARLVWSLHLRRPALVAGERLARPVMVWGHDTIVSSGVRRFRRALAVAPAPR
jgi:uncharacterized protein YndB with AHSA1/START domain